MPPVIATVLPDVRGFSKFFDFEIPEELVPLIEVGSIVRVSVNNSRCRAFVVDLPGRASVDKPLKKIQKFSSTGPTKEAIATCEKASQLWAGPLSLFLSAASPENNIQSLKASPELAEPLPDHSLLNKEPNVKLLLTHPGQKTLSTFIADNTPTTFIVPEHRSADQLTMQIRKLGEKVAQLPQDWALARSQSTKYIVGTRNSAFGPIEGTKRIVIFDSHDDSYFSQGFPTWNCVDLCIWRGITFGYEVVLVSPAPSLAHWSSLPTEIVGDHWPKVRVIDMRSTDPTQGIFPAEVVSGLRKAKKVACILNRRGKANALWCKSCGNIAKCPVCSGVLTEDTENTFACRRCGEKTSAHCRDCGSITFRRTRLGIEGLSKQIQAITNRSVCAISSESQVDDQTLASAEILVGTEALLHRISRCDLVLFPDIDAELFASRYLASEETLVLLSRAARIVGAAGGEVMVQTREPDNRVLDSIVKGGVLDYLNLELNYRKRFFWPPYGSIAVLKGHNVLPVVSELKSDRTLTISIKDESTALVQQAHSDFMTFSTDQRLQAQKELVEKLTAVIAKYKERPKLHVNPARL